MVIRKAFKNGNSIVVALPRSSGIVAGDYVSIAPIGDSGSLLVAKVTDPGAEITKTHS